MVKILYRSRFLLALAALLLLAQGSLNAQEAIGGPYTVDDNTLLLLHFDGNYTNESDSSADAVPHQNNTGKLTFAPGVSGLGQCLYIDNGAKADSAYVTVPDTSHLDLTGSWTIEGWMNVFTFGSTAGDYRWVPRLVIKPGDKYFWTPNYWVELWGDNRYFQTGYYNGDVDAEHGQWPAVTSAPNVMEPGVWVHLTFIRDNVRKILIQMVHNENKELVWFGTKSIEGLPEPTPTSQDIHIGWAGTKTIAEPSNDSWLHGFVDEIRISNVVRNFAVPPIFTYVTDFSSNFETDVTSYEVKARVFPFSTTGTLSSVKLNYSTNKGETWTSVNMTPLTNDTLVGQIPQMPAGTVVQYYVSATDNNNLTSQYPEVGNPYKTFGVYQKNVKVIDLDFEGNLTDASMYNQTVEFFRPVQYSTDAKVGSQSLYLPDQDSVYLLVDSPFLTANEFALDMWFKHEGDTILPFIRTIIRPDVNGNHVNQNYYIRTEEANGISAKYVVDPTDTNRTKNEVALVYPAHTIAPNKWFHALFERSDSAAVFELRDENDALIGRLVDKVDIALNPPIPSKGPLRIGWAGNSYGTPATVRKFIGKLDGIKIYNYAGLDLSTTPVAPVIGVEDNGNPEVPAQYSLSQNYPNPFNPTTNIKFSVAAAGKVSLVIYDVLGKRVKTLVDDLRGAGEHTIVWNGKDNNGASVASGIYFYQIKSQNYVKTMKMMLLK
jgi:hypothetical protein